MAAEIHVGDIGTSFRATVKDEEDEIVNLSTANTLLMWFRKPDGSVAEFTASLYTDGTDGVIEYITEENDLDQPGRWKSQGVVGFPDGSLIHSDIHTFKVYDNLSEV